MSTEITKAVEYTITTGEAFDRLKAAIRDDEGYAWGWQCNLAMPIMDATGITRQQANIAAARLMSHLFKYDITKQSEYADVIKPEEKTTADFVVDKAGDIVGVEENTLHITVTGFQANSGAEALARRLPLFLVGGGYDTALNIADTTLTHEERGLSLPPAGSKIVITGVESRWHTDRHRPLGDPDEAVDTDTDEQEYDSGDEPEYGEDPDCDPFDDVGSQEGIATAELYVPPRKVTLKLELDKDETNPELIVDHFKRKYPDADIVIKAKLNYLVTEDIVKRYQEDFPKDVELTIDPADPDPETTVDLVREAIQEQAPQLAMSIAKHNLADPESRKHAYLFERDLPEGKQLALLYVDTTDPEFNPESFVSNGFRIFQHLNDGLQALLEETMPSVAKYYTDLAINNERWLDRFGDGEAIVVTKHEGPFTLYHISQSAIPKTIYADVEDAWTALQNLDRLEDIAIALEDPSIVIGAEDYLRVTHGFMIVREHPRAEELFLKYLKYKAKTNELIDRWLRSVGK
ncbi:hypothetical protein MZD04_gp394 [Pseudomonas phage Psa21]|uniref:Uncharacterized protein n=1 Tax=Pseudomonas phage Psa21 TaxID=2530023 RepID=A0A481W512_9CAUD|nr:hypothetical protein MZD04_gp394 [Pseudomonas phage Psa21]QBJ02920.1 hypothetical protein PSA21_394 [Pseudomonas phage Psa21]